MAAPFRPTGDFVSFCAARNRPGSVGTSGFCAPFLRCIAPVAGRARLGRCHSGPRRHPGGQGCKAGSWREEARFPKRTAQFSIWSHGHSPCSPLARNIASTLSLDALPGRAGIKPFGNRRLAPPHAAAGRMASNQAGLGVRLSVQRRLTRWREVRVKEDSCQYKSCQCDSFRGNCATSSLRQPQDVAAAPAKPALT